MSDKNRNPNGTFKAGNTCSKGHGRPKVPEEVKEALRLTLPDAVAVLKSIMTDPNANASDRIRAAEVIANKCCGKGFAVYDDEATAPAPEVKVQVEYVGD